MKTFKPNHLLLALTLALVAPLSHAMEEQTSTDFNMQESVIVGDILLNNYPLSALWQQTNPGESNHFSTLPLELQTYIISLITQGSSGKTLQEAGKAINALAHVSTAFNQHINDPDYTLRIIKQLAMRFNCSDEDAAKALQTKQAKRQLLIQEQLYIACRNKKNFDATYLPQFTQVLDKAFGLGADPNFTYSKSGWENTPPMTPLMWCCVNNQEDVASHIIDYLLNNGANINQQNKDGQTVLMFYALIAMPSTLVLEHLLADNNIIINVQDNNGNTALMYFLKYLKDRDYPARRLKTVKILLKNGADPELGNLQWEAPLTVAEEIQNPKLIQLLKNAIAAKYQ